MQHNYEAAQRRLSDDYDHALLARFLLVEPLADEATFLIARTLNRSRADSQRARQRWWRVYSAFPGLYRDAAARCWQRLIINVGK